MPSFLNIEIDGKINTNFFLKHLLFSLFWIVGILLFLFRIDALLMDKSAPVWLLISLPTLYFLALFVYFYFIKWYYIMAFIFYPLLLIFWFIPKTVLSRGKIYLFGNYLSSVYYTLSNFKRTIFHTAIVFISLIFLITISQNWPKWVAIITFSYLYLRYIYRLLQKTFQKPTLFVDGVEEKFQAFIEKNNSEESIVIKSFINQKDDEKLELQEKRDKQIRRVILANYAITYVTKKLNGFTGKKAFLISWIYSALIFLSASICFFWFLNYQLYQINHSNFSYTYGTPTFDFLYYTLKTITFGDIELVKPISVVARISEICSFFIVGIFILVIFVSIILSLKQDKLNENLKLTTQLFESENTTLTNYFKDEFGLEIKSAINEVKNIDESIKNIQKIIDKLL